MVEDMCERNGNDIRSILNSLQFSSDTFGCASEKDESLRMDPFSATGRLFGTAATLADRETAAFVDHSFVPLMVHEAYLGAADKCRGGKDTSLEAAAKAADRLGDWDILDQRIHRTQAWGLLPAAMMSVVGAAKAANGPPPYQIFPQWLGKQSKRGKHTRLLRDMQGRMHVGDPGLIDSRCALRATLFAKDATIPNICDTLAELGMTRDDMLETLVETTFKGDEAEVAMETKKKSALTREWKKRHPEGGTVAKKVGGKKGIEVEEDEADNVGDLDSDEEYD
jgi:replication factor C subunit 1